MIESVRRIWAAIRSHVADSSNPHNTTVTQLGAYSKSEVDNALSLKANSSSLSNYDASGEAAAVQSNLTTHASNQSNPHHVTASQAGADVSGAAAAVQSNLTAHIANHSNPHSVTAAQAGAVSLPVVQSVTVSTSTKTLDASLGNVIVCTMNSSSTLSITNIPAAGLPILLILLNDAVLPRVTTFGTGFFSTGIVTGILSKKCIVEFSSYNGSLLQKSLVNGL